MQKKELCINLYENNQIYRHMVNGSNARAAIGVYYCLFTQDIYQHTYELAIESCILNIQVFNEIFRAANKYISRNVAKQVQCCYYQYCYTLIEYHDCWKGEPATGSNNTKVAMVAHVYIPTDHLWNK